MSSKLLHFKMPKFSFRLPKKLPSMSLLLWKRQEVSELTGPEYVGDKYFAITLAAAIALHLGGLYIWHLVPSSEVMDIPVHALSIKLGDGDPMTPEEQKMADQNNQADIETAITKMAHEQDPEARAKASANALDKANEKEKDSISKALDKAISAPDTNGVTQDSAARLAAIAKQFVRNNNVQAPSSKGIGNVLGNSTEKDAELMSRYDQLISAWIGKFKVYPDEARTQGIQGETVVRIRIDRMGNIRYSILEHSTGSQILDRAAIDMVKRANPVPAAPNDYPAGELLEFLIPVNFTLQ